MRSDRGAVAVLVAASLLMLFGIAAYVVDLSAVRLDRAADQRITDAAASAGALATFEGTAVEGCEDALAYVAINTAGINTLDDSECSVEFGTACSAGDARELPVPSGRWSITVVNPVPDDHRLMTPGQLGAASHGVAGDDGDPCDRFGVQMTAVHTNNLGQVMGFVDESTTVHSVAIAMLPDQEPPLNLLVLDRFGCDAIHVHGQGGVIVNAVVDPDTGEEFQGLAAADSDASSGCSPSVIHLEGNAVLRADGPPCPEAITPLTGEGCGLIQVLASGTPGCNPLACTIDGANAEMDPLPTALMDRLTRKQMDHAYNCWLDYTSPPGGVSWATDPLTVSNEQDIPGCTRGTPAHIYDLIASVGSNGRAGHTAWNADLSRPCNVDSATTIIEPTAGIWVDCDDFIVEGKATINGNVIFQGNVHVKSDGKLEIHNTSGAPGWAVFRGRHGVDGTGRFKKDGQAQLIIEQTAVYLSKSSWTEIAGGDKGRIRWIAPSSGGLEDLALWSDSPLTHFWAGQGDLEMVGAFFMPLAPANYSGSSKQNQTKAQWVADKLVAHGQGKLTIQPLFQFPVKRNDSVRTILIR